RPAAAHRRQQQPSPAARIRLDSWQPHGSSRRIRRLLLADSVEHRGVVGARRTDWILQLQRCAGPARISDFADADHVISIRRSASAADATRPITPMANGYRRILVTTNAGEARYRGLQLSIRRTFDDASGVLLSYTWSHTTNNVEPDAPGGDPNDVNLRSREWA